MLPRDQFADTFTVEEIVDTTTTLNQQQPSEPSRSDLPIGEKGHEQDRGLELIEGFDWSDDELRAATDRLVMQLNHRLPDYDDEDFWAPLDEDQLRELKIRLPLYRIRAHEVPRLRFFPLHAFYYGMGLFLICYCVPYVISNQRESG